MKSSNIIIVSNKKDTAKKVISKVVLLRSQDSVSVSSYKGIEGFLADNDVDLILLYAENINDIETIAKIKSLKNNVYVIVVTENENSDLLCRAFDYGANDFVDINTSETIFLMRVVWGLKRKSLNDNSLKKSEILSVSKILDLKSDFYRKEYTNKIFEREYKSILKSGDTSSFLLMITVDPNHRSRFSIAELAEWMKKVMRISDTAGFASDDKIYLILKNTSKEGVKKFFERLSMLTENKGNLFASVLNIYDKNYSDALVILNNLLQVALKKNIPLLFNDDVVQEESVLPSSQIVNSEKRNLMRKIERIINPAFFKMSAIYEPKFFDTKVIQSVGKYQSTFTFKSNLCYAQLKLSYGESDKISIETDCIFYGKEKIEVCEITSEDLSGDLLENIIQSLANSYKQALDGKEK